MRGACGGLARQSIAAEKQGRVVDTKQVRARVIDAQNRIRSELDALATDIGPGWRLCCDVIAEERYGLDVEYYTWIVNIEARLNTEYSSLPRPSFP
jgi:hypothetical protein